MASGVRVGSFELRAPLGSGGVGAVYRAHDSRLQRDVAIKVLHDNRLGDDEARRRFEKEARLLSTLSHPNIVTIFEISQWDGAPFIAMELVDGRSLRHILREGRVPLRKLLNIATQIADGLAAAHERDIAHRDLKPENVMIANDGRVKILDFGLARMIRYTHPEEVTADLPLSGSRSVEGTVGYMAPEQVDGRIVDFRCDQFSFGAMLYELATGRQPFRRDSAMATLYAILHDEPESLQRVNRSLPPPFCWIVERCLDKDPAGRYAATRDLARELQTVRDHLSETAPGLDQRPNRPRITTLIQLVGAVVALVVIPATVIISSREPPAPQVLPASLPGRKFVAVLPFQDLSGRAGGRLFSQGFADAVSSRLTQLDGVQIIPPSSSSTLVAQGADYRRIAQEVGATMLLTGTIQWDGGQFRVTYSLIDARTGVALRADTVTGSAQNVWAAQDQFADSVAAQLGLVQRAKPRRHERLDTAEAQELYVRALGSLQQYADGRSLENAVALLRELLETSGDSALVHAALGRAYLHQYNLTRDVTWTEKAIGACNRAKALAPDAPDVLLTLANIQRFTGRTDEAIESFQRVLAFSPESAEAAIGLAKCYATANRIEDAERAFRRGIALRPTWWSGHNELGVFYLTNARFDEAASEFQRVIELNPQTAWGYSNLGYVHVAKERLPEAVAAFSKAISIQEDAAAYGNLGHCYYFLGQYERSAQSHRKAVELRPGGATQWANLADACTWAPGCRSEAPSARAKAIELLRRDLAVNPKNARAHATLAICLAKSGEMIEAEREIREALELEPKNPARFYQAARIANLAGKPAEAIGWLQQAVGAGYGSFELQRDPEFAKLRETAAFQVAFPQRPGVG